MEEITDNIWKWVGPIGGVLIASFVLDQSKRPWYIRLAEMAAGMFSAIMLSKPISMFVDGTIDNMGWVGFLVGLLGMNIANKIFKAKISDIATIIKRR